MNSQSVIQFFFQFEANSLLREDICRRLILAWDLLEASLYLVEQSRVWTRNKISHLTTALIDLEG